MQLARLREPLGHSIFGKLTQLFRAGQIEHRESKQAILIDYLNRAPFGGNLVGIAAASWRYFGKPPASLSLAQSALLAGLPKNPNGDRPDRYPARAKVRRDHVLARMRACGMITDEQYQQAFAEPTDARWLPLPQVNPQKSPGESLAHGAMPTLIAAVGSTAGEQAVTIDLETQEKTIGVAQPALRELNLGGSHAAAAVVVLDVPTAECLAAVSIGDRPGLDLTHRRRSTGSLLKPFIYAAAFQAGIAAPQSVLSDTPTAWVGYTPRNFDHSFRGEIDADAALAESRNLPAMMLLSKVGVADAIRMFCALGLDGLATSSRPTGLTLAVGGAEASAWEIAQAYATLARGRRIAISIVAAKRFSVRQPCSRRLIKRRHYARRHHSGPSRLSGGAAFNERPRSNPIDLSVGSFAGCRVENGHKQRLAGCMVRCRHATARGGRVGRQLQRQQRCDAQGRFDCRADRAKCAGQC